MSGFELRDSEEARRFLLQGLWWQCVLRPHPSRVRPVMEWAKEIVSSGQDLPPLGYLADLGHIAFGQDQQASGEWRENNARAARPSLLVTRLLRTYEDHVLGRFYADRAFIRASDALRRYHGRDRARGLAFVFKQFAMRTGFRGVRLSPAVLKSICDASPEQIHAMGWESLSRDGAQAALVPQYEGLIAATRGTADLLGSEDVSQLERGTALKPEGEQLAERQVLQAARLLEDSLPRHSLRPRPRRGDLHTRILEEDAYPVGGFSSLSTRGSIESLLQSQLAYMENDNRPDLFDIKYLRDELLYYSRDENQLLRLRRSFVFVLYPDLDQTRFKDRGLDYQRGVLMLALLYVIVRKLTVWLNADELSFYFLLVVEGGEDPLNSERELLASLLMDDIANGSVQFATESENKIAEECARWARRSQCHALLIDVRSRQLKAADTTIHRLRIDGPCPAFADADSEPSAGESEGPLESWSAALQEILQQWI